MKNCLKFLIFFICLLAEGSSFCHGAENTNPDLLVPLTNPAIVRQDIHFKMDSGAYSISQDDIYSWLQEKNDLNITNSYLSEIENSDFCAYKKSIPCALTLPSRHTFHVQKTNALYLNTETLKKYLETLAEKTAKEPINATFEMKDEKISVFSLDQKGVRLDVSSSLNILTEYLRQGKIQDTINLPYQEKNPDITMGSIDNLGITSLIGEGRSNFRGSPKNRIFNIKVAVQKFNGLIIQPGEEFSFVKNLGEVDGEHGYLPELVIKNDKTEPEFGGGICQVSTTAFRAAIYSGLEITARRNHAYPVSYYNPQGMDSTVYIPKPDLRFINDTPGHILIQTEIIGTELIFRFFGTTDGRKVEIDGPRITEKNPDGSMKTVFTQKITAANGDLIREDIFKSAYDSPSKYPHPGDVLTQKPKDWSKGEWERYLKSTQR